jgi:hypothetical protein
VTRGVPAATVGGPHEFATGGLPTGCGWLILPATTPRGCCRVGRPSNHSERLGVARGDHLGSLTTLGSIEEVMPSSAAGTGQRGCTDQGSQQSIEWAHADRTTRTRIS